MTTTINEIKAKIEELVKVETGADIEWTFRGQDGFTLSGSPEAVQLAKPWFASSKLESEIHDEELCETFAFFK